MKTIICFIRYSGALRLKKSVDFEKILRFTITVQATDQQHVARRDITVLVLDANDNPPIFTSTVNYVSLEEVLIYFSSAYSKRKLCVTNKNSSKVHIEFRLQASVPELSNIGKLVMTIRADDADSGSYGHLSYRIVQSSPDDRLFRIDRDTGDIRTNRSKVISKESDVYILCVEVSDGGQPRKTQTTSVVIQVC